MLKDHAAMMFNAVCEYTRGCYLCNCRDGFQVYAIDCTGNIRNILFYCDHFCQPCLYPRTVTHHHLLIIYCATPCFSGSSSLAFFYRYLHQFNTELSSIWEHISALCPPPSPYLIADFFHVDSLAQLFI